MKLRARPTETGRADATANRDEAVLLGALIGVSLAYGWMALVVAAGLRYSGQAGRAAELVAERGSGVGGPNVDESEEQATD